MAELREQIEAGLRGSYAIERELGRGGMATVFLAQDLKHKRPVALKVLLPELTASIGAVRFNREIEIAARLQHPHILTVLDSGEAAGQLWFTMPYVDGQSLRDRLLKEEQLPVGDSLRITHDAAAALDYAHEQGVVHRDIKPENILLTKRGEVLVADFGIARAVGVEDTLTRPGIAIGTPAYMSPEQAAGAPVDARSDIYSLGCVLYEMLVGQAPYSNRRYVDAVPSVRLVRPSVSEAVDLALQRALAELPADRYSTAHEFAQTLQYVATTPISGPVVITPPRFGSLPPRVATPASASRGRRMPAAAITLALGFVLGLGVLFAWRRSRAASGEAVAPKVLAVLPFENLGDPTDAYFADGVADEVRTKLSQLPGMEVIARGSSNQYRNTTKSPQQIARELGADYLLTATVRWSKGPRGASREQLVARPTRNFDAYDAFLRGEQLIITEGKTDVVSARRAGAAYADAVQRDPSFALAWARLGRAEVLRYNAGDQEESVVRDAHQAADRALALAPNRAEPYYLVGLIKNNIEGDAHGAAEALERAWKLAPHDPDVLSMLGSFLADLGRNDEAVARYAEAARLDPRSVLVARRYADALVDQRCFAEADSVASSGLRVAADNSELVGHVLTARLARGDAAGARAALRQARQHVEPNQLIAALAGFIWLDDSLEALALRLPPAAYADDKSVGFLSLATVQWNAGLYDAARANGDSARMLLTALVARDPDSFFPHYALALADAVTGRRAEALAEAERVRAIYRPEPGSRAWTTYINLLAQIELLSGNATAAVAWVDTLLQLPGPTTVASLKLDPTYAPLRADPRFQELLARD